MERFITDERTGLKYELVGDYYLIAGEDEPEEDRPIGVWGQRHLRYLKEHHRVRYVQKRPQEKVRQEDRQQVLYRGPCGQRVFENADRGEDTVYCQEGG